MALRCYCLLIIDKFVSSKLFYLVIVIFVVAATSFNTSALRVLSTSELELLVSLLEVTLRKSFGSIPFVHSMKGGH